MSFVPRMRQSIGGERERSNGSALVTIHSCPRHVRANRKQRTRRRAACDWWSETFLSQVCQRLFWSALIVGAGEHPTHREQTTHAKTGTTCLTIYVPVSYAPAPYCRLTFCTFNPFLTFFLSLFFFLTFFLSFSVCLSYFLSLSPSVSSSTSCSLIMPTGPLQPAWRG